MSIVEIPLGAVASNIAVTVMLGMSMIIAVWLFVGMQNRNSTFAPSFFKVENALDFLVGTIIKYMAMGFIHEMGHLLASLVLGLKAEMGWNKWMLFTYNFAETPRDTFIIAASGALCIPFAYYLMREEEGEDRIEWKIAIVVMLLYSIVEVVYFVFF